MVSLESRIVEIGGVPTRILQGGKEGAPACLFLHGAIPGATPYCGGAHLWGDAVLKLFGAERRIYVPDLPGSGATPLAAGTPTLDTLAAHARAMLDALSLPSVHLIGHDLGGLLALVLGMECPERIASVSVVGAGLAAPLGDSLDDLVFIDPPRPLWGRLSQAWALDRISYSARSIDDGLLGACVAAGEGTAHRQAVAAMEGDGRAKIFGPSVMRAKTRLWEIARGDGLQVPVQLVWGSHDPTTSRERGILLFDTLAARQTASHFHIVNRTGNLVFRDEPAAYHQVVGAFQDGVMTTVARY